MKSHAALFASDVRAMQYASEWSIPAGRSKTGSGATSQSKSLIVLKVGVERREESNMASRPFAKRDSSSSASTSWSLGTTP